MQLSEIYFSQKASMLSGNMRNNVNRYQNMTKNFYSYQTNDGKIKSNPEKYLSPHQANILKLVLPPDGLTISSYQRTMWQKEVGKNFLQFQEGQLATKNLKRLFFDKNQDIQKIDISSFSQIEKNLMEYASALYHGNKDIIQKYKEENPDGDEIKYLNELKNNLIDLLNTIKKVNLPSQINYAFDLFDKRIESLKNAINKNSSEKMEIALGAKQLKRSKGIAWSSLHQIAKVILGYYLENQGITFFKKVMPSNIRAVQTGQIKGPSINILGRKYQEGKDIKEDILFFDKKLNLNISFTLNNSEQTLPLQDFLDLVENLKKETAIKLNYENYNTLIENSLGGIQSKLGSGNSIKLSNVSLGEVLVKAYKGNDLREEALYDLWYLKAYLGANILASHEYYDKFFNFTLARVTNYIVGNNNYIILTNKGFNTMYNFILENFMNGSYFYTGSPVSLLQKNRRLPIKFQIQHT